MHEDADRIFHMRREAEAAARAAAERKTREVHELLPDAIQKFVPQVLNALRDYGYPDAIEHKVSNRETTPRDPAPQDGNRLAVGGDGRLATRVASQSGSQHRGGNNRGGLFTT